MSSLWTPDGEHKVHRPGDPGASDPAPGPRPAPPAPAGQPGSDEPEPSEEDLREVARQLARAPVEDVIANHCYGLFELAALHLSQQPAQLAQAKLAIDAMGLLVDGLADRLGVHAPALREGVTQVRLAFVQIADASNPAQATESSGDTGGADRGADGD